MEPKDLAAALKTLRWNHSNLAAAVGCTPGMARRWALNGRVPPSVAQWLAVLAAHHEAKPAPTDWRQRKRGARKGGITRRKDPKVGKGAY